mgnify:CR=1 FL=1
MNACLLVGSVMFHTAIAQQDFVESVNESTGQRVAEPTDKSLLRAAYRDMALPLEHRVEDLMQRLLPEEKAELLHGTSSFSYGNIPRIGLVGCAFTDGSQGVRIKNNDKAKATAFPSGIAQAATWDPALLEQLGKAIAEECKAVNSRIILGPGVNIMRTPLSAWTFEYYGEDPYLAGKMASGFIKGVQSGGVAACLKHWLLNDQGWTRNLVDVDLGERALREIYVRPYEIAVKEANPWTIMSAYNLVRGQFCTHNKYLNDILFRDFNWDGALISDWGAWHSSEKALPGGCTLEMPSCKSTDKDKKLLEDVVAGKIAQRDVDGAVRRNLRFLFRIGAFDRVEKGSLGTPEHADMSLRVAESSITLLKNEKNFLPLDASRLNKVAVIGPNADQYHTLADKSGHGNHGGSGAHGGKYEITLFKALIDRLGKENVLYAPGFCFEEPRVKSVLDLPEMDPLEAARQADVVLFFGGTDHSYDKEKFSWNAIPKNADKSDLELKGDQVELIRKVLMTNPKTIVVLTNRAPVLMEEWVEDVPAIVESWYGGQAAGNAVVRVLFGEVNPSGKLPVTFGKKLTDWLSHSTGSRSYPGVLIEDGKYRAEFYSDYIWVGYRHFDRAGIEPRFPFGHGLSYTTFHLEKATGASPTEVAVKVSNTGMRAGAEVVQFYVSKPEGDIPMPNKELVYFKKVHLEPGASEIVSFKITDEAKRYWSENDGIWKVPSGRYILSVGNSSRNLPIVYSWVEDGRKIGY